MAFHMASIAKFAQLFNELAGNAVAGRPIPRSLDLIRAQFDACAAVLVIDNRLRSGDANYRFHSGEGEELASQVSKGGAGSVQMLASMGKQYHHTSSHYMSADQAYRYTLSLYRDQQAADFHPEETEVAECVVAQLARSIEMAWSMGVSEIERTLYSDVLERLKIGVMVLDNTGRVVRTSRIADRFLGDREGLYVQGGKLRALSTREDKALQEAIRSSLQGLEGADPDKSRGLSLTKHTGEKSLGVIIRRVESAAQSSTGQTLAVYIRDSEVPQQLEGDLVRQILDLTPAEAAVARRLTEGLSLDDAASSLAISRNTARAHLRSIFSKSGITRQTELVRMVLNSAAMLGEPSRPAA